MFSKLKETPFLFKLDIEQKAFFDGGLLLKIFPKVPSSTLGSV